ncbi:MAG: serine hydrolase [Pedobacter sp.]|nr:MAG: serine hydrolase [Pedobacter sp.]
MKYFFAFAFLFTSFNTFSQTKELSNLDSLMHIVLKDQSAAGFAVAVVKGDEVIYSKGFGYRDIENKKPVTSNTLFAIGSSTKAFTSSLIGLLQKEEKLKLDDKAVTHLPKLRFYSQEMDSQITIRDLMSHRTGLSRYDYSWLLFNTANRDSIIQRVKFMQPTAPVRQKWLYNNFMFLAQGMIVEKITGKTWEQNIKEKFFDPLGMTRSNTDINAFKNDGDAALPYLTNDSLNKKIDYYNINGMGPAGSINSSVNDMTNWLKLWIAGGMFNKKEVIPSSYIRDAASSHMVMSGGLPSKHSDVHISNYGLGWMLSSYRGHYLVEHGGNINGFSASVGFFPTDRIGIVVLTNQNGSVLPDVVRNSIADRLLKLNLIDWNGEAKAAKVAEALAQKQSDDNGKVKPILNTKPSHALKDYEGAFENPAYGTIKISAKDNGLYAQVGSEKLWLKHQHYDVFEPKSVDKNGKIDTALSKNLFNFLGNQEGKISMLTFQLEPDNKPVVFDFKPEVKVLSIKELEKYTGEYILGQATVKVYLKGSTLMVHVPGQPDYETVPTEDHTFDLKVLKGYSVKFELVAQKVTALSFIQPNGTFKATKKN